MYRQVKEALFADIAFHPGGNFTAPRTVIKCICWGPCIKYGNKLCFSFILPVGDLGLPLGYKSNPRACIEQIIANQEKRDNDKLERKYDLNLARLNNFSLELYENNLFENYFKKKY